MTSHQGPEGPGCAQLANHALEAQLAARFRPAEHRDALLVTPIIRSAGRFIPVGAKELSRSDFEDIQKKLSRAAPVRNKRDEGTAEREVRRVLSVQSSDQMTKFTVNGKPNSEFLPGGVPLIDHLSSRLEYLPDWGCLRPAVESLRQHRLPDKVKPASQREIVLGETLDRHVDAALEFLKDNIKLTKKKFYICTLAADVEAIGVRRSDFASLMHGTPGDTHVLRVAGRGESADHLPVLLMVGHVGWQVHIRLPTLDTIGAEGVRQLKIIPGELQHGIGTLFREIGIVAGVKIQEDLQDFFDVVKSLYGVDLWMYVLPPVDIDRLARYAGYNMLRYSVRSFNWVTFGTIMPKGEVSTGDKKWNQPWDCLPTPLRAYLAADIGQVAAVGWVMEVLWILHVFPDAHAVTQVSTLTPATLLLWWHKFIVEDLIDSAVPVRPWQIHETREDIINYLMGSSEHCEILRKLTPPWPTIPAGGARFVHFVRAFLISILPILRELDEDSWPLLHPEQYHLVVFNRHQVNAQDCPNDAVRTMAWAANPGVGPMITGQAKDIRCGHFQDIIGDGVGTKALLLEYARLNPQGGRDLLESVEGSLVICRHVFGYVKKAPQLLPPLKKMLDTFGMPPRRPEDWVDLYNIEKRQQEKVEAVTERAVQLSRKLKDKMEECRVRYKGLKEGVKAAKRKAPANPDHTWPLLDLVTGRGPPRTLTEDRLKSIGKRPEPRPSKRPRLDTTSGTSRPRPAETVTSGALEAEATVEARPSSVPSTIPVFVNFQRTFTTSDQQHPSGPEPDPTGPSLPGPGNLSGQAGPGAWDTPQRSVSQHSVPAGPSPYGQGPSMGQSGSEAWTTPNYSSGPGPELQGASPCGFGACAAQAGPDGCGAPDNSITISNIVFVGFGHAMRCNLGVVGSSIQLPAETIILDDWSDSAIEIAASRLRQLDLQQSLVVLWLHDDLVYVNEATGQPLYRSEYDERLHCDGTLGVVGVHRMKQLWDMSVPLVGACSSAASILLMTPLPRYITVPCCESANHCEGYYLEKNIRRICRDVGELREITLRWASRISGDKISVASPHLELTEIAKSAKENPAHFISESFSFDGIHLTSDGYRDLLTRVWDLLVYRPWVLRPPVRNMPSPMRGPPRPPPSRARATQQRRFHDLFEYGEFQEVSEGVTATRGRPLPASDAEIRASERGPWRDSEVQDSGPPIQPADWDLLRRSARSSGYNPASHPSGLHPG